MDRDSAVGIETRYRPDDPEFASKWGRIFGKLPDRCESLSLINNGYRVSFSEVKRPGRGVDIPTHLAQKLKKEFDVQVTVHRDKLL